MNRKMLGILLAVVLALSLTAACGGGDKTTTPFTIKPTTSLTATTPPPTSTSLPGAPTSITPTTTTAQATTTTHPPTSTTSAPPTSTGESLASILGRGDAITTLQFDMEVTSNDPNTGTYVAKVWMKQDKVRIQMTVEGETMIIIMDNAAHTSYMIIGTMAMVQTWSEDDTPMGEAEDILGLNPVVLGTETIDGKVCTVISYTDSQGGATTTSKVWIWNQYGLPIKAVITSGTITMTMLYKNIVIGGSIEDNLFQLPPGVTLITGIPTF